MEPLTLLVPRVLKATTDEDDDDKEELRRFRLRIRPLLGGVMRFLALRGDVPREMPLLPVPLLPPLR